MSHTVSHKKRGAQGPSLYWHDYETFGVNPRRDRPAQFAGIRTDLDLNVIGDPLCLYCQPADDFLPHPEACLVTGITPQQALEKGVPEAEFISRIHEEFAQPDTCVVGYNNLRFDDEVTRFTLYRNFFDAYAREWQNGNSRWDLIDVVRLTHALRPEGITWPKRDDGQPSFRLDQLTVANGIAHESAHDALSDVHATIAVARLIRHHQPRLYRYLFEHRSKAAVAQLLNVSAPAPVLHVSSMYPAEKGCIALVAALAMHPVNKNEIIVYDLRVDPIAYLEMDTGQLRERLFTPQQELKAGEQRLPVKTVHINKSPVVVPATTLNAEAAEKWRIDPQAAKENLRAIRSHPDFIKNLRAAFSDRDFEPETDPDFMLYSGGFFSNEDRQRMERVHTAGPEELREMAFPFGDTRLPEMLFRYRARNYPHTLNADERACWDEFRKQRLTESSHGVGLTVEQCRVQISALREQGDLSDAQRVLLDSLDEYADTLGKSVGL